MSEKTAEIRKASKRLERFCKGGANHWRIAILLLVKETPGLDVDEITENINGNFKTVSHHTGKLLSAGLLNKKYKGRRVLHELSPYGRVFVAFLFKLK